MTTIGYNIAYGKPVPSEEMDNLELRCALAS